MPPLKAMTRLAIDTDVTSYIFKWHPKFARQYAEILHASKPVLSFMTVAEMRQGALDANWNPRQCNLLEIYLADFLTQQSNDALCVVWAEVRNEIGAKGVLSLQQMPGSQPRH